MRWPESFTSKRRLTKLSSRSPALRDDAQHCGEPVPRARHRRRPTADGRPAARLQSRRAGRPAAPDQVLPGEMRGARRGSAEPAADQIGADVAGPDDEQQEQHIGPTGAQIVAQPQQRGSRPGRRRPGRQDPAARCAPARRGDGRGSATRRLSPSHDRGGQQRKCDAAQPDARDCKRRQHDRATARGRRGRPSGWKADRPSTPVTAAHSGALAVLLNRAVHRSAAPAARIR